MKFGFIFTKKGKRQNDEQNTVEFGNIPNDTSYPDENNNWSDHEEHENLLMKWTS